MPRLAACAASSAIVLTLAVACGPSARESIAEQPNFTVVEVATTDPGLLLTIMIDLGNNMAGISAALWRDDLATVARAAGTIADHPHVSTAERERIQASLGERFPDFVKGDHRVHESALRLAEHAAAGDTGALLGELAELQSGCVACHDAFRDELRTSIP